ncbi:MAG: Nicotinamide-nucleotide amidohydrolase PncC [Syntrophorhabdus sp. PtaU1.Bin002]|nr:MAG: Nicotinamide-nucleotide amidohydrolase PncC [Syntrophorhabdus sp. PtaB.Bin006]OPY73038.1 MAG: Nicotinamide-nucleotide amidohydrolase PncC [Syntrophorhabdus sp. PtaU1.Bin002]
MIEERIGSILREKGLRIAVAESCTGGLIANRITNIQGASDYFDMGFVTYSNDSKEVFLFVPEDVIAAKGAVSSEVARAMAEGVREATGVDVALSVTGIAGPGGGSPEKPVGTVYIGLAAESGAFVRKFLFSGDRISIKTQTSEEALKMMLDYLEDKVT